MGVREVARPDASLAISTLLTDAALAPSALILDGDAGIGKTTAWLSAIEEARDGGFRVLSTRPAAAESVMGYTALADLLSSVSPMAWADLPTPQREAVDRILLRNDDGRVVTDRRAVAAGVMSVVGRLAAESPVLLAVDDLQWLDSSSVHVLGFVARRLSGPIGLLVAARTDSSGASSAPWLQLPRPEQLRRITLQPLAIGALHAVLSQRLGRSYPRPTMQRVHETSGGNPFYAIELARAIDEGGTGGREVLPRSLSELVDHRIDSVDHGAEVALLASSCLAAPTVDLVSLAAGISQDELVTMLEPTESQGIVSLDGNGIRFAHPILARGVYLRATPAARRAMHRRLAELIDEPESQARHLALAATGGDADTLKALDAAADIARDRGAPEASAELVTLALSLGGDTPERRIRLARLHFNAGDSERARALLEKTVAAIDAGPLRSRALYLLGVVRMFDDGFTEAAELLERAVEEIGRHPSARAEMLILLAFAQVNSGLAPDALRSVEEAVALSDALNMPHVLSQGLGMRATLRFMQGDGLEEGDMNRAVALENPDARAPIAIRASVQSALLATWSGDLIRARDELAAVRRHCIEHGEDSELIFVGFHNTMLNVWLGDFGALAAEAEQTMERARQLNGAVPRYVALMAKTLASVFAGDVDAARREGKDALEAAVRSGAANLAQWPVMAMGFLEVSLGNYEAALNALEPMLIRAGATPRATEIISGWFLPDAIESMVQLGRLDDARRWADLLEDNGGRLDRPWMLAVGARGRAMVLAASGDLDGAVAATELALMHHDRVPMPFDLARTQLLLGKLQRRLRRKDKAATTLRAVVAEFDRLGTPLWAQRARDQLVRTNIGPREAAELTPSELRVAELAAEGMTNRDMAAALFISPKTVEANLSRVYRKLGIHSRAELGKRMGEITG